MPDHSTRRPAVEEEFSLPLFIFTVVLSFTGIIALYRLIAPEELWDEEIAAAWWEFGLAFVAIKIANSFLEFFFHRYILHKPAIGFLSRFYRQHTLHHSLTRITRRRTSNGRELPCVENIYPITEDHQKEASFFPWYTLLTFALVMTPLFTVLHLLMPSLPWFLSGYTALAASLVIYEVFHAIEHWPFEKWAPLIEHRFTGRIWTHVYSFHLRHHAVIDCNEAISGFFTFPLPDLVFGTWVNPKTLYVDGGEWEASEFHSPKPCTFIRWCDATVDRWITDRRQKARQA